jgi:uncharacterized membrane protein
MRLLISILLLLLCLPPANAAFWGLFDDAPESVIAQDGKVVLDVGSLPTESSRHYLYKTGNASVKFFLVRDRQNAVRAAVDACEVCWGEGKGYVMKEGTMVCINCGRKFPLERIGMIVGGCNPHPLKFTLSGSAVVISAQELSRGAAYFPEKSK